MKTRTRTQTRSIYWLVVPLLAALALATAGTRLWRHTPVSAAVAHGVYTSEGFGGYLPASSFPSQPLTPLEQAVKAYAHGQYKQAETLAQTVIEQTRQAKDKQSIHAELQARLLTAYCAAWKSDYSLADERFAELQQVASRLPDHGKKQAPRGDVEPTFEEEAAFQQAVCLGKLNGQQAAEAAYRQFMQDYPDSILVHAAVKRISYYHHLDVPKDAETLWQRATHLQRLHEEARLREASLCAPECLAELLKRQGKKADVHALANQMHTGPRGTSIAELCRVAKQYGYPAQGVEMSLRGLSAQSLPVVAMVKPGHFVLVERLTPQEVRVWDPDGNGRHKGAERTYSAADWQKNWQGIGITLAKPCLHVPALPATLAHTPSGPRYILACLMNGLGRSLPVCAQVTVLLLCLWLTTILLGKSRCGRWLRLSLRSQRQQGLSAWQACRAEWNALRSRSVGGCRRLSWSMKTLTWLTTVAMTGLQLLAVPAQAQQIADYRAAITPKKSNLTQCLTPAQWKAVDAARAEAERQSKPEVRLLNKKEMAGLFGRGVYRSKYISGTFPWNRSLRDANLCYGNLFKSFTDIQVAPAKGAGLALQRTYNSDDDRIGPFGIGWTHAYDIRIEEENPATNYTDSSLNYSDRADFFGARHKYHRDADGLYSPPPYLFDELSSAYNDFLVNGPIAPLSDDQKSMDGTTKHFTAIGNARVCTSITDRYNNVTTLAYTTVQVAGVNVAQLTSVTDPSGRQLVFHWTNFGVVGNEIWRIVQVDGPQYSVVYGYGADYNLASVTLDASTPAAGVASVVTGPAPHTDRMTTFGYTSVSGQNGTETGLLSSITDPLGQPGGDPAGGHVLTYSYNLPSVNPTGTVWVSTITEPAGVIPNTSTTRTLTWTITPFSTPTLNVQVSAPNLQFALLLDNQLRAEGWMNIYPLGNGTLYGPTYDSANNVTQYFSACSLGVNQFVFPLNRDIFTFGPHGNQTSHSVEDFTGTESTGYDDASQYFEKSSVTDMNGHTSTFIVGDDTNVNGFQGSIQSVQDAGYNDVNSPSYHKQFSYLYYTSGQKARETTLNNVATTYTYGDQWSNLTQVIQDPGTGHLNRTTTLTYDAAGHVLTSVDPNGRTSNFSYNNLGQPLTASFPATGSTPAETISYTYAANGRTVSVTDNRGTTAIAYEPGSDRVSSVTDPVDGTISYTYGINGERRSLTLPGGGTWTYGYAEVGPLQMLPKDDPNSAGLPLTSITDDTGRRVNYQMDEMGHLASVQSNQTFNGSTLVSYCHTDYTNQVTADGLHFRYWLQQVKTTWNWQNAQGQWQQSVLAENDYTYDLVGQRLTNTISGTAMAARTENYGPYDDLNRVTTVNYGDGQTQSYTFDPMGNRLSKTDAGGGINGTENYSYNAANMLVTRGSHSYTNDMNGNTLTDGGHTNTWDSQNRLYQCVYVNGSTTTTNTFAYGADGLRRQMSSTVGSTTTTTNFVYDSSALLRERRNNANYATYLTGARGPEYRRDDTTGNVSWYVYDGLRSVVAEVKGDGTGTVTASRKYDVFGSVRGGTNPSGTSKQKFVGGLGHVSDDETGYVYMRARYMDPTTGRFASQDSKANGTNWFVYCLDNPINFVDESGDDITSYNSMGTLWLAGTLYLAYAIGLMYPIPDGMGGTAPAPTTGKLSDTAAAAVLLSVAACCFGGASLGMPLSVNEKIWIATSVIAMGAAFVDFAISGSIGMKTIAGAAVVAELVDSVIEMGYISSIGADAQAGS